MPDFSVSMEKMWISSQAEFVCSGLGIHVPHSNPTTNEIENRILT